MSDDGQSQSRDELAGKAKRIFREAIILGLIVALAVAALAFALDYADQRGAFRSLGFSPTPWAIIALGPLILAFVLWVDRRRWRPLYGNRGKRKKIVDELQKQQRFLLILFVIIIGYQSVLPVSEHGTNVVLSALLVLELAILISYGQVFPLKKHFPDMDDEYPKLMRIYSARVGYLVVIAALGIIYWATLNKPNFVAPLVRGSLFVGVAVPAIYFLMRTWRAERVE